MAGQQLGLLHTGVRSLGVKDNEASSLDEAIKRQVKGDGRYELVTPRRADLADRCKRDLQCHCQAARRQHVAQVLLCNVGRIDPVYTFELVLIDSQSCSVDNSIFTSEQHRSLAAATRALEALVARVLQPRESVSETAAKTERNIDQSPALVSVITAKQIKQLGITRLREIFRLLPGFEMLDANWGDRVLHHGLTTTLLYMVDGIPMSNPKYNFRYLGRDFRLLLGDIERIEVLRGPASTLWGQNAFLGVVNLAIKMPSEREDRVELQARYGSQQNLEFHGSLAGAHGWIRYYAGVTLARSKGPRTDLVDSPLAHLGVDEPVWGNSGTTDNDVDEYIDVVTKLRLLERLELLIKYFENTEYFEISPYGSLLPPDEHGSWESRNLVLAASWQDRLARGFSYRLQASRYTHWRFERYIIHPKSPALAFGFSSLQGNETKPQVNHLLEARLLHEHRWRLLSNRLLVAASFLHQHNPVNWATLTRGQEEGTRELDFEAHRFLTGSGYLQDDLSLLERLSLSGGVRYDWHDPFEPELSLQAGLIGGVERLFGKLIYAEGFRPPNMNYLYSTTGTLGNPSLRPEKSRALSAEIGGRPSSWVELRAGGSLIWLSDLIRLDSITDEDLKAKGFVNEPKNRADTQVATAYAELRLRFRRLDGRLFYCYKQLHESDPEGDGIPVAHHTAGGAFSWRPFNDFNFFATGSFVGPRRVVLATAATTGDPFTIRAYGVFDVGFTITNLLKRLDLTVELRNPAQLSHKTPYALDGRVNWLVEPRVDAEVMITLGWSAHVSTLLPR